MTSFFNESTTTTSQLFIVAIYGFIVLVQLLSMRKDPLISFAFMWFLIIRHMITFAALLFCSFWIFISISFVFIVAACIDVGNFYEEPTQVKETYKIPFLKIRISTKRNKQLIIFFALDVVMWMIIMAISQILHSPTLWHRIHF